VSIQSANSNYEVENLTELAHEDGEILNYSLGQFLVYFPT